jgi:NADH dehydrogenase FAD-containing subunit
LSRIIVVITGGELGGLNAAGKFKNANADITLIDKTKHHLFQPLLYRVTLHKGKFEAEIIIRNFPAEKEKLFDYSDRGIE